MYYIYVEPKYFLVVKSREEEVYKPSKAVMREHEAAQIVIYCYKIKG